MDFLLKIPSLRHKSVELLRQRYPETFCLSIPLTEQLYCPIHNEASLHAFSKMFVARELDDVWAYINLPSRWLDIGCRYGYFSLYIILQHRLRQYNTNMQALLVDANPYVFSWIEKIRHENFLSNNLTVLNAAVAHHEHERVDFDLRTTHERTIFNPYKTLQEGIVRVPRLKVEDILLNAPPSYDLIRLNVVGSESFFIEQFADIIQQSKSVLIQWDEAKELHEAEHKLASAMAAYGFTQKVTIHWPQSVEVQGQLHWKATDLFIKKGENNQPPSHPAVN